MLLLSRNESSLEATIFSIILEKELKSEMGLQLSMEVLSPDLNIGITFAIYEWIYIESRAFPHPLSSLNLETFGQQQSIRNLPGFRAAN